MIFDSLYEGKPHVSLIRQMIENALNQINTILPGKVVRYNPDTGRAEIQPLNKLILKSGSAAEPTSVELPPIDNIPVCFFGSPMMKITHKVTAGDTGLLLVCQRAINEFKAASLATPEEPQKALPFAAKNIRKFDINDAMFFPVYFSGDKGFDGLSKKISDPLGGDVKIGVKSDSVEISSSAKKTPLKIQGADQNLLETIEDLKDQISSVRDSVRAVATSNPLTQPSLAAVETNTIISKIKSALNYAKQKTSFLVEDDRLLSLLRDVGTKALGVALQGGKISIKREDPADLIKRNRGTDNQPISISIDRKYLRGGAGSSAPADADPYGWALAGMRGIGGNFANVPSDGLGQADFSPFTRIDRKDLGKSGAEENEKLIWADLIALVFSVTHPQPGTSNLRADFYWGHPAEILKSSVKLIKLYAQKGADDKDGTHLSSFPVSADVNQIRGHELYIASIQNNVGGLNLLPYKQQDSAWDAFFGSKNSFEYPFLLLKFYSLDASGNEQPIRPPINN